MVVVVEEDDIIGGINGYGIPYGEGIPDIIIPWGCIPGIIIPWGCIPGIIIPWGCIPGIIPGIVACGVGIKGIIPGGYIPGIIPGIY